MTKIHKGDTVQILVGKDAKKQGKVLKVDSVNGRVLVEGLNVFKKHKRPRKQGEKGEIIKVARPLDVSKVSLFCSNCARPVRVGFKFEGTASLGKSAVKIRICKKCKKNL